MSRQYWVHSDFRPPQAITLKGREDWAMDELLAAGESGCTPIDHPGPRWSDYVFKLRRRGIEIETITEGHDGPYAGHHARYVLRSDVRRTELCGPSVAVQTVSP